LRAWRLGQRALALGAAVAVADEFVAARHAGRHEIGAVVVERRIDERGRGPAQIVEQFQAAPGTDAVAALAPAVVQHVGLRRGRPDDRAQALAEGEMLVVDRQVRGQPLAAGAAVSRSLVDGAVSEAPVVGQQAQVVGGHGDFDASKEKCSVWCRLERHVHRLGVPR
jgi:hypothetical protein